MPIHQCNNCNRNFKQKSQLDYHLNRKNKCQPSINSPQNAVILPQNPQSIPQIPSNALHDDIIPTDNTTISNENYQCNHCNKSFGRKDNLHRHTTQYCPIIKQQNKAKQEIFDKLTLLEVKNKQLEEEIKNKDKVIENKDKVIEDKDKLLIEEINTLRNEIKMIQPSTINTNSNNNIMNNSNNTVNVINIVPHGQEDLAKNKIDDLLLIISTKKGYNSVLELISRVHFNSRFPEFQNVYIPDIKNNTAMVFGEEWELKNIEDVITDLHDSKSDYIMDNKDIFYKHLNVGEQAVYARWAANNNNRDTAEFKEYITDIHKKIKLLMYNKREMVIETKKLQAIKKINKL